MEGSVSEDDDKHDEEEGEREEEDSLGMGHEVEEEEEEEEEEQNQGKRRKAPTGFGMHKRQATSGLAVMKAGSSMFGAMGHSSKAVHVADLPTIAGGTALPPGAGASFQGMLDVAQDDGLCLDMQYAGPSSTFKCTFEEYMALTPEMKALVRQGYALELEERRVAVRKQELSMAFTMPGLQHPSTDDSGNQHWSPLLLLSCSSFFVVYSFSFLLHCCFSVLASSFL